MANQNGTLFPKASDTGCVVEGNVGAVSLSAIFTLAPFDGERVFHAQRDATQRRSGAAFVVGVLQPKVSQTGLLQGFVPINSYERVVASVGVVGFEGAIEFVD